MHQAAGSRYRGGGGVGEAAGRPAGVHGTLRSTGGGRSCGCQGKQECTKPTPCRRLGTARRKLLCSIAAPPSIEHQQLDLPTQKRNSPHLVEGHIGGLLGVAQAQDADGVGQDGVGRTLALLSGHRGVQGCSAEGGMMRGTTVLRQRAGMAMQRLERHAARCPVADPRPAPTCGLGLALPVTGHRLGRGT